MWRWDVCDSIRERTFSRMSKRGRARSICCALFGTIPTCCPRSASPHPASFPYYSSSSRASSFCHRKKRFVLIFCCGIFFFSNWSGKKCLIDTKKEEKLLKLTLNILNNIAHQPENKVVFQQYQASKVYLFIFNKLI